MDKPMGQRMDGFFRVVSVAQCQEALRGFPVLEGETLPLELALGRVLAGDVTAREDLPLATRSSMDGYALAAADTFGAGETNPGYLDCVAAIDIQTAPTFVLMPGQCASIVTGGLLPQGADAVLQVEQTARLGQAQDNALGQAGETIEIRKAVAPGEAVMHRGEDARAGQVLLPGGTRLRAQELGLLAALGEAAVPVRRAPRVAILSTGDEVIPLEAIPVPGQVRDVNRVTVAVACRQAGAVTGTRGIVGDDPLALKEALEEALADHDVVLLSGGSSVGTRDYTLGAIMDRPGAEVLVHGVAMSPGKPVIVARVPANGAGGTGRGRAVIGLPGQVASALVVMQVLVAPFLRHLLGDDGLWDWEARPGLLARLDRNLASRQGREDYVRVRLSPSNAGGAGEAGSAGLVATPELGPSGLLRSLVGADGLVRIPANAEGLLAGTLARVVPFQS